MSPTAPESPLLSATRHSDAESALRRELAETRARLSEAEATLDAIRRGGVDAILVEGSFGREVFTHRNAQEPFGQLIEQLSEGTLVLSRDGIVLYSNKTFGRMVRTPMPRILGTEFAEFLSLPDRSMLNGLLEDAWIGSSHGEATALTPDGALVPLRLGLRRLQLGPDAYIAVVATDLTEVRRQEEEVRRSEHRLQIAVAAANLGAWDIDLTSADRSLRLAEEPYVAMLGREAKELPRNESELFECIHPEDRDLVRRSIATAISGDAAVQCEFRLLWQDGSVHWHAAIGSTTRDAWGRPIRLAGVGMDVTRRHETEAEIRQNQKLEAIGHVAGGLAHDFDDILAAMRLQLELLEPREDLAPDIARTLRNLEGLAGRASDLTRHLLMFGRRCALSLRLLDLNAVVIDRLRDPHRPLGDAIEPRLELAADLPPVEVDPGLIDHVLTELLENAREAMTEGGIVHLQTSTVVFDLPRLARNRNRRAGPHVCLTVRDTGRGIDPELLPRIFEPFLGTQAVGRGRGRGLGLATVHGIVAQHRGWVEIESLVGLGTTVRVYLPAAEDRLPKSTRRRSLAPERPSAGILVVEDDPKLRRLVGQALDMLGYRTYEATTGAEAIAFWKRFAPHVDLLLSDTVLPGGISGLQLAERLRESKPELKVIMTRGSGPALDAASTIGRAAFAFLPNPYEIRMLANMVRGCLAA
ncbi:MAG: PAS domain-containing protein [Verrucomicrobiales bacterium]|nr:PAS domain-containing protein [Verrucomicrobiales bacterium]